MIKYSIGEPEFMERILLKYQEAAGKQLLKDGRTISITNMIVSFVFLFLFKPKEKTTTTQNIKQLRKAPGGSWCRTVGFRELASESLSQNMGALNYCMHTLPAKQDGLLLICYVFGYGIRNPQIVVCAKWNYEN